MRRGESKCPLGQIVHRAARYQRAAIHGFDASGEEAVEVERAILVPFRHKDVSQPMAANHVVRPSVERLGDGCAVIAVDLRRVKRQRDKVLEVVRQREPAQLCAGSPHAALHVAAFALFARFAGRGLRPRFLHEGGFPSRFAEDGIGSYDQIGATIRVCVDDRIVVYFVAILHDQSRGSDVIMS